tara:strand:- start:373 stop:675 length:303 start_codon:yes stop_codon:yes gene_type:complete
MAMIHNYLESLPNWSLDQATAIAETSGIQLGDDHIAILEVARQFFNDYGFSPSMRPLCKTLTMSLGVDKGRSIYLNQLFPGSPAKQIALLAGLPRPKNCL